MILFALAFGYVMLQIVISVGQKQEIRHNEKRERDRIRTALREDLKHAARSIDVR